jgi:hypothetical protein
MARFCDKTAWFIEANAREIDILQNERLGAWEGVAARFAGEDM